MTRLALSWVLLAACADKAPVDTDPDTDPDTVVDPGTDPDTDPDSDTTPAQEVTCSALPITLPYTLTGNSWFADFDNAGNFSSGIDCIGAQGTEVAFEVDLVANTSLTVIEAGGADVVIHVKEACEATAECLASVDDNTDDRLDWVVPEDGTYTVIVEGWSENANGDYDIRIATTGVEVCDDDQDNDLDGAVDCDDPDCATDPIACPFECASTPVNLPFGIQGDDFLLDFPNDQAWGSGVDCIVANGPEAVFDVSLQAGQRIRIQERGSFDATVHVIGDCVESWTCEDSVAFGDEISFTAEASGTYTVVVEGASTNPFSRAYDIAITELAPEDCLDGIDNDGDDDVDCDDVECFNTDACPFECPSEDIELVGDLFSALGQDFTAQASPPEPYGRGEGCVTASGSVLAWDIELGEGESVRLSEVGRMNATWHVLQDCTPGTACAFSSATDSGVGYTATTAGVYTVVLQAGSSTDINPYEAYIRRIAAEDCEVVGDEDLDGLSDCDDADCQGTASCPFTCEATEVLGSVSVAGEDFDADYPNDWSYGDGPDCSVATGAEATFQIDLLAGQSVRVTESGPVDVVLHVSDTCLPERRCLDSQGSPEELEYTAVADGTYTVTVEGRVPTTSPVAYDIQVEFLEPEICADGQDNDLDALADCDDPDCFGDTVACTTETTCFDGADNDGDGDVDCDDADCNGALGCGGGSDVLVESFDLVPPTGWRIVDGGTVGETWALCQAPGCTDILTQWTSFQGAVGGFAYANSDDPGFGTVMDDALESPVMDLSSYSTVLLRFDHLFDAGGGDAATVEVSSDGEVWEPVFAWTSDTINGEPAAVSLNALAGVLTAQVRFRYTSQRDWFWAIDNVQVRAQ